MGYKVISLKNIYNNIGENETKEILKKFKCELNKDVEYFLKEKAIEFSKQGFAETFIVTSQYKNEEVIVGYFATTSKAINLKPIIVSKTKRKQLLKYAQYDNIYRTYNIALPLIGQLGKNYNNNYDKLITGDMLLKLACDKVKKAQEVFGGKFVFLECEDKPKLKEFYENNGFVCFGKRNLEKDERETNSGEYLLQMLCDLSKRN
ncbi:MAG: N-acetyltransferase [Clostridia bacterium]|nr:N-acetyltransferase [Clostridia bacterium]